MPRTIFDTYAEEPTPPIDWMMAAILERMRVLHLTNKDLAAAANIHYDTMRRWMLRSPAEWPRDIRDSVCKRLGITVDMRKALS